MTEACGVCRGFGYFMAHTEYCLDGDCEGSGCPDLMTCRGCRLGRLLGKILRRDANMTRRFDYVKYDEEVAKKQELFKFHFESLEQMIDSLLQDSRPKSLLMTALEEAYMWAGKALRDEQIAKNPATPHVETRTNE